MIICIGQRTLFDAIDSGHSTKKGCLMLVQGLMTIALLCTGYAQGSTSPFRGRAACPVRCYAWATCPSGVENAVEGNTPFGVENAVEGNTPIWR